MKANELMIGDWVKFGGRTFKLHDVTVINPITNPALVTRSHIRKDVESPTGCFNDALIIESALPLKDIYPIPLTKEILDKNCANIIVREYVSCEWTWYNDNGDYIELSIHAGGETCEDGFFFSVNGGEYYLFTIYYVHELQHALRLCGIEKEIVL